MKTVQIGSLPNSASGQTAHNISNLGTVIDIKMSWYDSIDNKKFTTPRIDDSTTYITLMGASATAITYKAMGTDWSTRTRNCIATIWYTKSS